MIWGAAFSFQSIAMETMTPLTFTASRMIPATAFLWVLVVVRERLSAKQRAEEPQIKAPTGRYILAGAVCGLFLCLGTDLQQIGILLTTVGKSGFLTSLYTVLVPVAGFLIFRKKMPAAIWLGALLALAGVYFLSGAEGLDLAPEDLALIGCAVAFTFQILFVDFFVKDLDPVKLSATQFLFCVIYSLAAAFIWEKPTLAMMTSAIIPTLYAGVISGGVGYTLQIIGQKLSDPAPAAILMSLEAVFSALFGALILHQMMSGREILGSCIMFAAVILVQLSTLKE